MKLTKSQRETLKQKYDGHCAYCGCELGDKWHADHHVAIRRNGDGTSLNPEHDSIENMMPACAPCNINKKSLPLEAWREQIKNYEQSLLKYHNIFNHAYRFDLVNFTGEPVVFYFERFGGERG